MRLTGACRFRRPGKRAALERPSIGNLQALLAVTLMNKRRHGHVSEDARIYCPSSRHPGSESERSLQNHTGNKRIECLRSARSGSSICRRRSRISFLIFQAHVIALATMTTALAFAGLIYGIYSLSGLMFCSNAMRKHVEKDDADIRAESQGKGLRAFLFRAIRPLYWLLALPVYSIAAALGISILLVIPAILFGG